jgi:hypothetical protein
VDKHSKSCDAPCELVNFLPHQPDRVAIWGAGGCCKQESAIASRWVHDGPPWGRQPDDQVGHYLGALSLGRPVDAQALAPFQHCLEDGGEI